MKRSTTVVLVSILLVLVGTGSLFIAYKGYRKYQAKQNQEYRFEGTMGNAPQGFELDIFRQYLLADEVLNPVIEELNLINEWDLNDMESAKRRIREKFNVRLENVQVKVSYQDKSKDLAHNVLNAIIKHYRDRLRSAGGA